MCVCVFLMLFKSMLVWKISKNRFNQWSKMKQGDETITFDLYGKMLERSQALKNFLLCLSASMSRVKVPCLRMRKVWRFRYVYVFFVQILLFRNIFCEVVFVSWKWCFSYLSWLTADNRQCCLCFRGWWVSAVDLNVYAWSLKRNLFRI